MLEQKANVMVIRMLHMSQGVVSGFEKVLGLRPISKGFVSFLSPEKRNNIEYTVPRNMRMYVL